jgi:hypothetical protein
MRPPGSLNEKLELYLCRAAADSRPEEFLNQIHYTDLPAWDQYTHIRIAFIILTMYGRQKGKQRMPMPLRVPCVTIYWTVFTGKNMILYSMEKYVSASPQTRAHTFNATMTYLWMQCAPRDPGYCLTTYTFKPLCHRGI